MATNQHMWRQKHHYLLRKIFVRCLEYFSGYCFGEMYRKLRKSKGGQSEGSVFHSVGSKNRKASEAG